MIDQHIPKSMTHIKTICVTCKYIYIIYHIHNKKQKYKKNQLN